MTEDVLDKSMIGVKYHDAVVIDDKGEKVLKASSRVIFHIQTLREETVDASVSRVFVNNTSLECYDERRNKKLNDKLITSNHC